MAQEAIERDLRLLRVAVVLLEAADLVERPDVEVEGHDVAHVGRLEDLAPGRQRRRVIAFRFGDVRRRVALELGLARFARARRGALQGLVRATAIAGGGDLGGLQAIEVAGPLGVLRASVARACARLAADSAVRPARRSARPSQNQAWNSYGSASITAFAAEAAASKSPIP